MNSTPLTQDSRPMTCFTSRLVTVTVGMTMLAQATNRGEDTLDRV